MVALEFLLKEMFPELSIAPQEQLHVKDLRSEEWREYDIPGRDEPYRIEEPIALYLRPGGTTHRVLDTDGVVHCVPFTRGVVLRWMSRDGYEPVTF